MNSSIYKFLLDLQSTQSQIALPVTRGDTAREFHIRLADGGLPYVVADGVLAKIDIKRPTGTHLSHFCPILNNRTIQYKFSQDINTAAVEGVHDCEVILYNAEFERVASARFTMVVSDRVVNSDDIVLTDEDFTAVDEMLAKEAQRQVDEAERITAEEERKNKEADRIEAEENRVTLEKKRQTNEEDRQTFEAWRKSDEDKRRDNEKIRVSNEEARERAENERALAETSRDENEVHRQKSEYFRRSENERRQAELNNALERVEGLEGRITEALATYIDEVDELIGGEDNE